MTSIWLCSPRVYQYDGWLFEYGMSTPWPLRKDGELRARAGRKFYEMIRRFEALPKEEQSACRLGGGESYCPYCGMPMATGHLSGCKNHAAIAKAKVESND